MFAYIKVFNREMGFSNILYFAFVVTYFSGLYTLYTYRYLVSDMAPNKIDICVFSGCNNQLRCSLKRIFEMIEAMQEQKDHFATFQAVMIGGLVLPLNTYFWVVCLTKYIVRSSCLILEHLVGN